MKVLVILALVAAASCAPAEDKQDRTKRNLYGAQYGVGAPLLTSQVQSNTLEQSNYQASNLKATSSQTSLVQPSYGAGYTPYASYQSGYQPGYQTYYQPGYQTGYQAGYQPSVQVAYQPSYQSAIQPAVYNYQQPSYYSAPAQSQYYNVPSVQYLSQPGYNLGVQSLPSYQLGGISSGVVNDPWC